MEVRIQNNSAAFVAAMKRQLAQAANEIGETAVKHAQDEIIKSGRVKTGAMYRSISFKVQQDGIYIGTNDRKAKFHELGTGRFTKAHHGSSYGIRAVHYLHHAASRHWIQYMRIILKYCKG